MPNAFTVDPFDASRYLGTTCSVGPTQVSVTLTRSAAAKPAVRRVAGDALGEVGDFVVVDASPVGVFGRISNVSLPERERLSMEADSGELKSSPYPVGQVQLLAAMNLETGLVSAGLSAYPRLGCRVYSAHPEMIRLIAESALGGQSQERDAMSKMIAHVAANHIAERRAYSDCRANDALREVEMTGAEGDIGDNERDHDAEDRGRDTVQHLHGDQQHRIVDRRK